MLNIDYKWKAFSAVGMSLVTMVMSMSMIAVALPSISAFFGSSLQIVSWVVIANSLTVTAVLLPFGRLSDLLGRKLILTSGLLFFLIGSLMCMLANNIIFLIFSRVVMGLGGAMAQAVGTAIVVSVFKKNERGKGLGSQSTAVALGGALGPVVGGLILQFYAWQAVFICIFIMATISFIWCLLVLKDSKIGSPKVKDNKFDLIGAVFSGVAMFSLVLSMNNPFDGLLFYLVTLISFSIFLFFLIIFIQNQKKSESPIIDLKLFLDPVFRYASITRIIGFIGRSSLFILMPIYLINIRNLQPAMVGIILLGSAVGMGIGAQMGGRLADIYGHRRFTIIGFLLAIITGVFIANFNLQTSLILIVIILLFNGFSMGVWATPNQLATMNSVTKEKYGSVGAFVNLTRNTGNVIGQALATSIISFVMIYKGFDVELSEVGKIPKTTDAFILGWEIAYIFVIIITFVGLISAIMTKPKNK